MLNALNILLVSLPNLCSNDDVRATLVRLGKTLKRNFPVHVLNPFALNLNPFQNEYCALPHQIL